MIKMFWINFSNSALDLWPRKAVVIENREESIFNVINILFYLVICLKNC